MTGAVRRAGIVGDRLVGCRATIALAEAELGLGRAEAAAGLAGEAVRVAQELETPLLGAQALMLKAWIHETSGEAQEAESELRGAARLLFGTDAGPVAALSGRSDADSTTSRGAVLDPAEGLTPGAPIFTIAAVDWEGSTMAHRNGQGDTHDQ
ncbi:hypothetical protein GXW82_03600 [Streptacidiphilus sp. 4-A2]|nr:hypothetical protein [Streptacidiphilus sp. 4-A2]